MVHLNVLQEMFDLFPTPDDQEDGQLVHSITDHQLMLRLSVAVISGNSSPNTMCLTGMIQD